MPNPVPDLNEVRRNGLTKKLNLLVSQYEATQEKAALCLNPSDRIALEEEAKNLWQRAEAASEELRLFDSRSPLSTPHQKTIAGIDSMLSSIDFSLAKQILANIVVPWENRGGCAAFLLQKSFRMRGDLLLLEVQKFLQSEIGRYKTPSLKHYRICLKDNTLPVTQEGILERLCRDLNANPNQANLNENLQGIVVQELCRPLRGATTLFLEIGPWDEIPLEQQSPLLDWFLQDFWTSLVQQHNQVAQDYSRVQCIAMVYTYSDLPDLCRSLCDFPEKPERSPDLGRLINLPLEPWTETEILDWLEEQGYLKNDCRVQSRRIYQQSDGQPRTVHALLDELFQQKIAN